MKRGRGWGLAVSLGNDEVPECDLDVVDVVQLMLTHELGLCLAICPSKFRPGRDVICLE
jgi:hypothetical protein